MSFNDEIARNTVLIILPTVDGSETHVEFVERDKVRQQKSQRQANTVDRFFGGGERDAAVFAVGGRCFGDHVLGVYERIDGVGIGLQTHALDDVFHLGVRHVEADRQVLAAAVDRHDEQLVFTQYARNVQAVGVIERGAIVFGAVYFGLQRFPAAVLGRIIERIVNRLPEHAAVGRRHDGRDDVDELCQARDLDAVAVVNQRVHQRREQHGVGKGIYVFELRRRDLPRAAHVVIGMVPHVPLVERKVDFLVRALAGADGVAHGNHFADKRLHVVGKRQVRTAVVPHFARAVLLAHTVVLV